MRRCLAVAITVAFGLGALLAGAAGGAPAKKPPRSAVQHVFIVVIENASYDELTGPSAATTMPYLTSLAAKGVTLDQMFAIDHASLGNYIGVTSGYEANDKTKADCLHYDCVYPTGQDDNIANQLEAKHLTWTAYMDGMTQPCQKPPTQGAPDPFLVGYATRHDPFMYYSSIVDDPARCAAHVVPFEQLATDLGAAKVPTYSFISPDTCNDAHDRGDDCGLTHADDWMKENVQPILNSKAYKRGGVLIVTTDESLGNDRAGCCGNAQGGHIGTFVISPLVAKPGSRTSTQYTHFSMLRWVENTFGLPCLRHACDPGTNSFGTDIFKKKAAR
jgi:hypothetical protein